MTASATPRLVVSAPASSQGKTTIALGLMAALREQGHRVAPFKTGPDYIDPGYHALAAGRPGRNLDAHLCGPGLVAPLFLHGCTTPEPADVAVIEGAMGLFDGHLGRAPVGRAGFGSSAHIARLVDAPVLLVVDTSHSSRTTAAVAHGLAHFDPDVQVAGVLLNRVGSARNVAEVTRALTDVGLPVVGAVPRAKELTTPSRHLGLVPAAERGQAEQMVADAARLVREHVDLDAVLALARTAGSLETEPWDPSAVVQHLEGVERGVGRPRIAIAGGRAFTFRYAETAELLTAAGCEVVDFDPMTDRALPERTSGLYLGGGFPEVYAEELAGNLSLLDSIRSAIRSGLPTVAECAGLLYLCRTLDGRPMAGAVPLDAAMSPRLVLGYQRVQAAADSLLARRGEQVATHEFHRTQLQLPDGTPGEPGSAWPDGLAPAWQVDGRHEGVVADPAGNGLPTVHAAYQHLHWAGFPQAASRFAAAAARFQAGGALTPGPVEGCTTEDGLDGPGHQTRPASEPPSPTPGSAERTCTTDGNALTPPSQSGQPATTHLDEHGPHHVDAEPDLTHHGDHDLADGLVDLAVNVHAPVPPRWLGDALARPERWAGYPDATAAREALAARHGVEVSMVLPTAGAAEAFTLLARALAGRTRHPLVVHPQFTEPEQALRAAGHQPRRLLLRPDEAFTLRPELVDHEADLVVVGNPTNPTGVLHPADTLRALQREGRVLLVDEAFMDAVPGEPESLVGAEMPGLLVTRSLTKTWSLAGIRAGYVVGDPELVALLEAQQPHWSVGTPALDAMVLCSGDQAREQQEAIARQVAADRQVLVDELTAAGFPPVACPQAPFVLVDTSSLGDASPREALAKQGFAVRRGESFPGLGPSWIRLAVRDADTSRRIAAALAALKEDR